ncbi:protein FAR1-RELATED SEQUENCE 3 [Setaria italica]|uniref:protein FAR1-RELATED SEQUENCE 3 n=1 Tax=Setaria italica TaxID=4555 RepID=UPI000BE4C42B|nr:protein FAR1-RELATED SEQUENCE 3 [Setaria italica]
MSADASDVALSEFGATAAESKSSTSGHGDAVIVRRFVCSLQGLPARKDPPLDLSRKRRDRASSRAACPTMIQVNRLPGSAASTHWVVSRCVFDHTHRLGGDDDDDDDGSDSDASGSESADTPTKHSSNKSSKVPSGRIANTDADSFQSTALGPDGNVTQCLLEHFKKKQAENRSFCYAIQVDRSNYVTNFLWVDARARLLYKWFGDAVVLDVTCKRNLPAAPFVALTGLNHHRQVIVFGYAILTDESEETYVWLFETWLASMGGKKPVSLTINYNRDAEMAAMKVFDDVRQRLCQRDIFSRCKERLAAVYEAHPSFKQELKECVNELERNDEFESKWRFLLNKYNLTVWLTGVSECIEHLVLKGRDALFT